ncbi:MAG TPA: PHB depolymerase family esterase [Oligoflexus sp.]|uniref:PHB depolymerase family esterase n=1 Tax=Oligoflexus sp. TaxID=1971216 RepID=UPI002D752C27|nr:PHB depolymerase family esterase [Oligoflexus sp.]HYX36663.1 PHB depolymerase family esterase [Oligoflexus sp.]
MPDCIRRSTYSESKSYPLVVMLHGVRSSAEQTDLWLGLTRVNDRQQFLLLMPNGQQDSQGKRFWNATTECCDKEKAESTISLI